MINKDIEKILATEQDIESMCKRLGTQILNDYNGLKPVFVGLLKGCQPFMGDLIKHVNTYCEIDYMKVSSYDGVKSKGAITIKKDIDTSVEGKHVVIVDDIIDTGVTISTIVELFKSRGAKTVEVCTLLDKPSGKVIDVKVKYVGMDIPGEFVVGYGLDYNELYRNLPYIGVLKEQVYNAKENVDESK
ncbi:MAG: hypoxanthine phosphoribosyltransferase [Anaeroplasmataceae bacterium]